MWRSLQGTQHTTWLISNHDAKENFDLVDGRHILARLAAIPIETWNFKGQDPGIRHIGPMAQDFAAAFGVGADDKHINMIDASGVALASIQSLYELVLEKEVQISVLQQHVEELRAVNGAFRAELDRLKDQLIELEASAFIGTQ